MKHVKCVAKVVNRALEGESAQLKRQGRVVYEAVREGEILRLYHYGTTILWVEPVWSKSPCIRTPGAYSASDRDAINTVLYELGLHVESGGTYNYSIRNGLTKEERE